jgi:hypothetical protein
MEPVPVSSIIFDVVNIYLFWTKGLFEFPLAKALRKTKERKDPLCPLCLTFVSSVFKLSFNFVAASVMRVGLF